MAILKTRVVGAAHREGAQARLNGLRHGHELVLKRERNNRHDRAAVGVWDGDLQIGYISRDDNRNLAIALDAGVSAAAFIDGFQPKLHVVYPYAATISKPDEETLEDWLR